MNMHNFDLDKIEIVAKNLNAGSFGYGYGTKFLTNFQESELEQYQQGIEKFNAETDGVLKILEDAYDANGKRINGCKALVVEKYPTKNVDRSNPFKILWDELDNSLNFREFP